MSTKSHNMRVGNIAMVTGICMAVVAGCHFVGAKLEESRIISRAQYIEIESIYNLAAKDKSCFPRISKFGTGSPAQEAKDRRCIGNRVSQENLDAIRAYNEYHGLPAQTGRWSGNVFACGLIFGGVIAAGIGIGYREG